MWPTHCTAVSVSIADLHLTEVQHPCLAYLRAVFDVVSFVEAKVAQVVGWRSFAGFA